MIATQSRKVMIPFMIIIVIQLGQQFFTSTFSLFTQTITLIKHLLIETGAASWAASWGSRVVQLVVLHNPCSVYIKQIKTLDKNQLNGSIAQLITGQCYRVSMLGAVLAQRQGWLH